MLKRIQKTNSILCIYFGMTLTQIIYSAFIVNESDILFTGRVFSFIIPAILAYYSFEKFRIAQWLLALFILSSGITGLFNGLFFVPLSQYFLKLFLTILGLYLAFGGYILLKITKEKKKWFLREVMQK